MPNLALTAKPFPVDDMATLEEAMKIGQIVAQSKLFPEIQDQAKAVVAILAGRELGIPPMASLRGIHVIKGKVEVSAGLIAAMIRASGRYDYRIIETTEKICRLAWSRNGAEVGESSFSIDEAKRAKLIKPDSNWEKFPKAMLFARAMTAGQKLYAPDIGIGSVYAPGEIADVEAEVIDISPEPLEVDAAIRQSPHEIPRQGPSVQQAAQDAIMPTAREIFDDPRPLPDSPLPQAWTADTAARELADRQIANTINKGLKTISDQIAAEAPAPLAPDKVDERAQQIAEAREKHIKAPAEPDPVPALKPTLSPAQQKVSDAVMLLYKEHKKDKKDTLIEIEKFLGRPVKASKDLTDEDAERVFAHLQTLASELSAKKTEPTKTKYDQKTRAHGEAVGKAMDQAIKRLTILNVPFGPLYQEIADIVEREISGRKIETRYELDNDEAQAILEFLQTRILEKEKEIAAKAAQV